MCAAAPGTDRTAVRRHLPSAGAGFKAAATGGASAAAAAGFAAGLAAAFALSGFFAALFSFSALASGLESGLACALAFGVLSTWAFARLSGFSDLAFSLRRSCRLGVGLGRSLDAGLALLFAFVCWTPDLLPCRLVAGLAVSAWARRRQETCSVGRGCGGSEQNDESRSGKRPQRANPNSLSHNLWSHRSSQWSFPSCGSTHDVARR